MPLGLFQNIDSNRRKSYVLIILAVIFLGVVGAVIGGAWLGSPLVGVGIASAIGLVMAAFAWHRGSSLVMLTAGASEISAADDPLLVNVVEEMAISSGLPKPRVFIMNDPSMNAFAAGIAPDRAMVAVTSGLRQRLNRDELQGVIAHEMSHIGNYDTRVMILLAVIVGTIAILCDFFLRSMLFSRRGSDRSEGNARAVLMVVAIVLAILAPIAAMVIQFAVSRRREYLADATAAAMTRNPGALADALEKLGATSQRLERANRGTQHLFIVNPLRPKQQISSPFATHPPIEERIARLRQIAASDAESREDQ